VDIYVRTYITHSVLGIDSHELGIYVRTYITHSVLGIDSHEVGIYVSIDIHLMRINA
jgi:hypothetical protein